jgi:hypothetical protein
VVEEWRQLIAQLLRLVVEAEREEGDDGERQDQLASS